MTSTPTTVGTCVDDLFLFHQMKTLWDAAHIKHPTENDREYMRVVLETARKALPAIYSELD